MMDEQQISKVVEQVLAKTGKQKMTLKLALALSEKIEQKAQSMGLSVVIAVADQAARPVLVHCMEDSYIASYDIAVNKAYTSASLKMSTEKLSGLSQPGQPLYGIQHTNHGKIVIFGGGEVLEYNGKIMGALGVSGGTLEQDTYLAAFGKEIFGEVKSCR